MPIDTNFDADPRDEVAKALAAESAGYDSAWLGETKHDPLLGCGLAVPRRHA